MIHTSASGSQLAQLLKNSGEKEFKKPKYLSVMGRLDEMATSRPDWASKNNSPKELSKHKTSNNQNETFSQNENNPLFESSTSNVMFIQNESYIFNASGENKLAGALQEAA